MNRTRFTGSAVFGILLIAVGVISLLSGLNYFDSWDIFSTYWPLVIVLLGVRSLVDHRASTTFGIILIAVGAFLQIDNLGLWYLGDINVRELIIPMIIILVGLNFILPRRKQEIVEEVLVEGRAVKEKVVKEDKSVEAVVEPAKEEVSQEKSDATLHDNTEPVEADEELPEA